MIRGSKGATTNFLKHLKRKHSPQYETYLKEKNENLLKKKEKLPAVLKNQNPEN